MKLKIMTFNTQHCMNFMTGQIDFEIMADAIRMENPDIVGLQEMRNTGTSDEYKDQMGILGEMLGMHSVFGEALKFCGTEPYGVGVLSKYPILAWETHPIPDPEIRLFKGYYETRTVLDTKIDIGEGEPLNVFVSHFGLNPDEHLNAVTTACKYVKKERSIFMGDLNMTPDKELIQPLFYSFCDTATELTGSKLTFPSNKPEIKIDYIFTTSDIKTTSAHVVNVVASDHCPYVAEIEV